jgi:hypothetical protein
MRFQVWNKPATHLRLCYGRQSQKPAPDIPNNFELLKPLLQMNSPEIKTFIRENSHLFWYTPEDKKEEISHEFLVETILNYGSMDNVLQLFRLLGIKHVAEIFFNSINLSARRKGNYYPEIYHYFSLVLKKYA